MSEVNDTIIYNFYDYVKSIYIYTHLKTHLKDRQRQVFENATNYAILIILSVFLFLSAFKICVILFYFLFLQAFASFIKFLRTICKTKFRLNFCSSFKNAIYYLGKICKRIYTFNFYLYTNRAVGFIIPFSYFFFLISSSAFYAYNIDLIDYIEKPVYYVIWFYSHFESIILLHLIFSCFYAYRDMTKSTMIALGLFVVINIILILGYCISEAKENVNGSYDFGEPEAYMNIILNSIFLCVNLISFYNIIVYKKNSKFYFKFIMICYIILNYS
jgi:hypothetical protein